MNLSLKQYRDKLNYYFRLFQVRLGRFRGLDWEGFRPVFIVSTGRTGTTFLGKKLNVFDEITARHEPRPTFFQLGVDFARGNVSIGGARRIIERDRRVVLSEIHGNDSPYYVESNNRFFSLIPVLREVFPDAKFIHIVRDGRDYVRSGYSRNWYTASESYDYMEASDFPEDPFCSEWETMDRFEKICWRWQKKDSFILDSTQGADDALILKFEDIFDDDEGYPGMRQLLGFVDPEIEFDPSLMEKKIRSTSQYELPPKEEWSQQRKNQFRRIAGDHMIRHGYFGDLSDW